MTKRFIEGEEENETKKRKEEEDDDEEEDEDEYDEDNKGAEVSGLPQPNSETIFIPLIQKRSEAQAYVDLIEKSPLSTGIKFESGYQPKNMIINAVCKHGNFTSFELEQGDWEAYLTRFPKVLKSCLRLKRVIIAGASQSGCEGYDTLLFACLQLPELEYLDCSDNYEDMGQAPPLAQLILQHKTLKTIHMEENDLEEDQYPIIVAAIKEAAEKKSLVLQHLVGITLNDPQWQTVLGLPDESRFREMSNDEILEYLKEKSVEV